MYMTSFCTLQQYRPGHHATAAEFMKQSCPHETAPDLPVRMVRSNFRRPYQDIIIVLGCAPCTALIICNSENR